MLVLTRRIGETIVIDGNIHITVVAVKGNGARLAIYAPSSVRVDRQEVHQRRRPFAAGSDPLTEQPADAANLI
jgi:carbon storage regulator